MIFHSGPPPPFVGGGGRGLDFWTQQNPEETEIFQNQGAGEDGKGEFFKFSSGKKIAGDETLNRKQNFRMNLKMFSWVI